MTSKKGVSAKRAVIPREARRTKTFLDDCERLNRTGRFDMHDLKAVMLRLIANDGPLPPGNKDHPLQGEWNGFRECHVHGDFLLLYRLDGSGTREVVTFVAVGTHAELFR